MKFRKDLITGIERSITSWKTPDDPSNGLHKVWLDTKGYTQILMMQGSVLLARIGPWNGVGYSGFPNDIPNPIYSVEYVVDQKEIYHKYELIGSIVLRVVLTWDRKLLILNWIERIKDWVVYADAGVDSCERFGLCSPHGSCSMTRRPPCTCLEGFEPRVPEEWKASDWSSGCQWKKPLGCENGDGFQRIRGMKLPTEGIAHAQLLRI